MKQERGELLEFPCSFPIKVFGQANAAFETAALAIVRQHVPQLAENAITMRYSKDKKFLSLTITIQACSQQQLDGIYSDLSSHAAVIMAL
jgi:putative lipoic acid-binding regulatory protein